MIETIGLSFNYNHKPVLTDIDLKIREGEIVSIIGPNGSGKTTLLRCINKILKPRRGEVFIMGENLNRIRLRRLSGIMGYVPQRETDIFSFTVLETILMGRRPYINWKIGDRDMDIVNDTLQHMKLDTLKDRRVDELSGGERQRVLIARALAQEPSIMILDEPTSNLDPRHQLEVFDLIRDLAHKRRITILYTIHDLYLAARFSDRVIMLKDGEVIAEGPPQSVLSPDNLKEAYGIRAYTCDNGGVFHVVPTGYCE